MKATLTIGRFPLDGSIETLGFGVIRWVHAHLVQPDGDSAGEPFRLTAEQINFILWFYAVNAKGRFVYRRGVLRRAKGWGKSPFLGAIAIAELLGPVCYAGRASDGRVFGRAHPMPWVVLAGVSESQTQNTMDSIRGLISEELKGQYGLDVGLTRIYTPGGGKLVPLTASSATAEGQRPTFAILDETHHWHKTNGGHALAHVIKRNLAKVRGRSIETTNAHEPGQDSVGEKSYLAWLAIYEGRAPRSEGILYDSREAPEVDFRDEALLIQALACAYGDSTWVDLERILGEIYDPDTSAEEARRFYLNQIIAAADSWVTPTEWDENFSADLDTLSPGEMVTLGFDGALTDDSSALVACRVSDGAPFLLDIWERPEGPAGRGWEIDKERVRGAVDHAFATFDVVAFFSDVAYWETDVDAWRDSFGERLKVKATTRHSVAWDMRGHQADTVRAVEALHRAIADRECHYTSHEMGDGRDGLKILRRHVLNARRRPNRYGISFGKESRESPKKVDALAALVLARLARSRAIAEGVLKRRHSGRVAGF